METSHEDVALWNILGEFFQRSDFGALSISTHWLLNRWRKEN